MSDTVEEDARSFVDGLAVPTPRETVLECLILLIRRHRVQAAGAAADPDPPSPEEAEILAKMAADAGAAAASYANAILMRCMQQGKL